MVHDKNYKQGDTHHWSALYSWFMPFVDNEDMLVYQARMNGRDFIFIDLKRDFEGYIYLPSSIVSKNYTIVEQRSVKVIKPQLDKLKLKRVGALMLEL